MNSHPEPEAVLFLSYGGPEKPDDVMPFLKRVCAGRNISPERLQEVIHHYESIGGVSPLNGISRQQAKQLENRLKETSLPKPVYVGQLYMPPLVEEAVRKMTQDGILRAVAFVATAFRSDVSWGRYCQAVDKARQAIGLGAPEIDYVSPWFDHPLFIEAICDRIQHQHAKRDAAWIFVAHSIPCAMAKQSAYVEELQTTARLVCQRLGQDRWNLAYCSRSGSPSDPWLEPDVHQEIKEQAKTGTKNILLIPFGFVADNTEVLFDLDVEAKQTAHQHSVVYSRVPTVGVHPSFIRMMAEIIP